MNPDCFRYHNDMMISHEKSRGQSVIFNANFSTLRIPQVTQKDSGNYTCAPHNMRPHLITVQVLGGSQSRDGEETAAAAATTLREDTARETTISSLAIKTSNNNQNHLNYMHALRLDLGPE